MPVTSRWVHRPSCPMTREHRVCSHRPSAKCVGTGVECAVAELAVAELAVTGAAPPDVLEVRRGAVVDAVVVDAVDGADAEKEAATFRCRFAGRCKEWS